MTSNCINPGYVRTPLVEKQIADQARTHGIDESEVVEKIMLDPLGDQAAGRARRGRLTGRLAGRPGRGHGHRRLLHHGRRLERAVIDRGGSDRSGRYEAVDVEVRGGSLRVGIWGTESGPPVLAIHGITASHLAWQLVAEALPDLRIIAPDLRGRGRSSELPGPYGFDQHADDLARLIDQLGLGPVPIVGHSMGGFVAVAVAHRHPDLISGVLLLDGGLPFVRRPGS